jgi:hypothetical protein
MDSFSIGGKSKELPLFNLLRLKTFLPNPRSLHTENPKYNSDNAPLNTYGDDFSEISLKTKNAAKWMCQKCGFDLSSKKEFLHTHHKNGAKFDNNPLNLSVLCYGCHADEPGHHHMKNHPSYAMFRTIKAHMYHPEVARHPAPTGLSYRQNES